MTALSFSTASDTDEDQILLHIFVNKECELTENIDPKKDAWKLAELPTNDISMNGLRNKIPLAFKSKKSVKPLFANINEFEWKVYSYEPTTAAIEIEEDDDLQTEIDVQMNLHQDNTTASHVYLRLRVVFHKIEKEPMETLTTGNTKGLNVGNAQFIKNESDINSTYVSHSSVAPDSTKIPCEQCGEYIPFNEYQDHQFAHMISAPHISMHVENEENKTQPLKSNSRTMNRVSSTDTDLKCLCGGQLTFANARQVYNRKPVSCYACGKVCKHRVFHCIGGKIDIHPNGFDVCQECGSPNNDEIKHDDRIPVEFKDPITNKIMKNPTMIVSSAQIYDEITVDQMITLKLDYDIITGIPFSFNGWPLLAERRIDIKEKIDLFLKTNPKFKTHAMDTNDAQNALWRLLLKQTETKNNVTDKVMQVMQDESNLTHTAKQIFKPLQHKEEKNDSKYDVQPPKNAVKDELRMKAKQLHDKLDIQNRRWLLTIYKDCFLGSEAVQVIMNLGFANDVDGAVAFGNKLMEHDILWHVTNDQKFCNYRYYYKFVEDFSAEFMCDQEEQVADVYYDDTIVFNPNIPVVCIMGPSRSGKSTLVNDILGVKDVCKVSSSSNVALTQGAWITKYSLHGGHEGKMNELNSDQIDEFYLLDMEGLSHGVTKFTKKLFYACYAISNVVIWNDKNVGSDDFKKLMKSLKKEMEAVATSDYKPSFLYLERDAGDYSYKPFKSLDEYIKKHESFTWFKQMNIFASLSGYELVRPVMDQNSENGELNFSNRPENRAKLIPLISEIMKLSKTSDRFALDMSELKKQVCYINQSTALNVTEMSVSNNEILGLFALSHPALCRRSEMIYVACEFNWDHKALQTKFTEEMNKMKAILIGINEIDYKIIATLEKNKKEIYQRIKNSKRTSYKELVAKSGSILGLTAYTVGMSAGTVATGGLAIVLFGVTSGAGAISMMKGAVWMAKNKYKDTRREIRGFATRGYLEYSLGATDEEIEQK